jgi:uncharacterized protein YuzE
MKILTPYHYATKTEIPYISVNKRGNIMLNKFLIEKLNISNNEMISFCYDDKTDTYYLGKTPKGNQGFRFRLYKKERYLITFCKKLTTEILKNLSVDTSKGSAFRFKVHLDIPVRHFGMDLYKFSKP